MSGGGTETHKHPLNSVGDGRMRSSLKLSKLAKGCLNCYAFHNSSAMGTRLDFTRPLRMASVAAPPGLPALTVTIKIKSALSS